MSLNSAAGVAINSKALAARPCVQPGFKRGMRSASAPETVQLRQDFPYYGDVEVEVPGAPAFTMYSEADDNVAYTYFFWGAGSYETMSTALFVELAKSSSNVLDIGAHTGLFTLAAGAANRDARLHYFEVMPKIA